MPHKPLKEEFGTFYRVVKQILIERSCQGQMENLLSIEQNHRRLFLISPRCIQHKRFGEVTEWTDKPTVKVAVTADAPAVVKLLPHNKGRALDVFLLMYFVSGNLIWSLPQS
ncbi:hypothetical protein ACB092_04G005400 [Castanea dentata]